MIEFTRMSRIFCIFILTILATILDFTHSECGCKKLKRNDPPPDPQEDLIENLHPEATCHINADGTKVCSNSAYLDDGRDEDSTFKRLVRESRDQMSLIPGDPRSQIGTDKPIFVEDRESPVREVNVEPFYLDRYEVSNGDFGKFVEETGYRTDADVFGDSFVFRDEISEAMQEEYVDFRVASATWWYKVKNVTWQQPEGPGSSIVGNYRLFKSLN